MSDIRDAWIEIEEAGTEAGGSLTSPPAPGARLSWIASMAASGLLIVALMIPAVRHLWEPLPAEMRVEISTPSTPAPFQFALSPDGRRIVFVASGDGPRRLWLRSLDKIDAQPIVGTDGAELPFWSADSRSIGYFASGKLYRVETAGGPPQVLAEAPRGFGGAWNADGTILFAPERDAPLVRMSASGGEAVPVTHVDPPRQVDHRFPQFLPDGRHFLFYAQGGTAASGIYLGSLDQPIGRRSQRFGHHPHPQLEAGSE